MSVLRPAVDFSDIRKTLVAEVAKITGLVCIREEPSTPDAPRPPLPYFGYKITTPGEAKGEAVLQAPDGPYAPGSTAKFNYGQQMKMIVSFQCYAKDQDDAYSYMVLWQNALNLDNVLEELRRKGLAVWDYGNVADLSALLNTGYEGRSQLDVNFGYASNLGADLGAIEATEITGEVDNNGVNNELGFDVSL